MRHLPTATTAPKGRRRLWCAPRACAIRCCALRFCLGPAPKARRRSSGTQAEPKAKLIGGGRNLQQPLYVDDLARAAMAATQPSVANNRTLDLVGPVSLPERELVERAARLLGRQVRIGSIPKDCFRWCWPFVSASAARIFAGRSRSDHGGHAPGPAAGRAANSESNSPESTR